MAASVENRSVDLSLQMYGRLLRAYPETFRNEYGAEMMFVFRDRCREVIGDQGVLGLIGFWLLALLDLIKTSVEEHMQKEGGVMSKSMLIRGAGVFLLLTGVLAAMGLLTETRPTNGYLRWLQMREIGWTALVMTPIAVSAGLLSLYLGYREMISGYVQMGLLLALGGSAIGVLSLPMMVLLESVWPLWWMSGIVMVIGLSIFAVAIWFSQPLSRWNRLLTLPGVGGLLLVMFYTLIFPRLDPTSQQTIAQVLYIITGLMWALPGIALIVSPGSREMAPV